MRINVHVSFWVPREERDRYYRLIEREGYLEGWHEPHPDLPRSNPGFEHMFNGADPRLEALRSLLKDKVCNWLELVDCVYDDAELKAFPLLLFGIRQPLIEGGGTPFGTEYDASKGCPRCGTGAVQTSPLMVPPGSFPKRSLICETYSGGVLVAKELAEALRKARVSGLELRQVCSPRGRKLQPWWQTISTYTMPRAVKGMDRDVSPERGCTVCERDLWAPEDLRQITYARSQVDPATLPDVAHTWECYGRSIPQADDEGLYVRNFAQPFLLFSQKVFDLLRKLKVKQAEFSPVRIE